MQKNVLNHGKNRDSREQRPLATQIDMTPGDLYCDIQPNTQQQKQVNNSKMARKTAPSHI